MTSLHAPNGEAHARILIVDDQEQNIRLLTRILNRAGYENIAGTTNSEDTLTLQSQFNPDLVLLDLHLRGKNGFEVLAELLAPERGGEHLPVIMLTADDGADTKRRALELGAKDFVNRPFDSEEVLLRIKNLLETKFLHESLQGQNSDLERKVAERTKELEQSQLEVLERLAAAVEFRDDDTGEHTKRVGIVSAMLADALGLHAETVQLIGRGAPLHDIGKVGIPDNILLKAGPLTTEEFEIMKAHTVIGARMLANGRSELVRISQRIALSHHEWWDGSGYPHRTSGHRIPLEARIVAVADFLDALTHDRPYRLAWSVDSTLAEIKRRSGSHFDPAVADALVVIDWRKHSSLVA